MVKTGRSERAGRHRVAAVSTYDFRQVDVFSDEGLLGNPVAVVHDADGLSEDRMAAFARWTNLSETTFLSAPSDPRADYRLRIFTPGGELPFAGHPTLGSAHAWLEAGGEPTGDRIVQECGVGLVEIDRTSRLAFAAPELIRGGEVDEETIAAVARGLGIDRGEILDARWCDNGPGWVGVMLKDADAVLALVPDTVAMGELKVGVVGRYPEGSDGPAVEVRAFVGSLGIDEDPVTGSLNAALGQWLAGTVLPRSYVASQGICLQRRGRVHVTTDDGGRVWVGGDTRTTITGRVVL